MRPRKIKDFWKWEKLEIMRLYVHDKIPLDPIYKTRYASVISRRTFYRYVKEFIPNPSKYKCVRENP
jgi:hypothetical protein